MSAPLSIRFELATVTRGARDPLAAAAALTRPNEEVRRAIDRGAQTLLGTAIRERFRGKGPFPVAQHKLGNVSSRLRGSLYNTTPVITGSGYEFRMGSPVEYFGIHEFGFVGSVSVRAHTRKRHTIKKRNMSRLEQSVRAHTKDLNIAARAPLSTAIEEHGARIIGEEIRRTVKNL